MSAVELGIGLQGDRPLGEYGVLGRLAEEAGFAVVTAFADAGYAPPLPILLEVARVTERVRLGPSCLNPYTTHPVEIASQVALLDAVSGGRAYVGLAKGAWLEGLGVSQPRPVQTLREAAAVVDVLLRGDEGGFEGEVFSVAPGTRLQSSIPMRRVPLLIGAWGPRTVALAGDIAEELKVGGSANAAIVPVMRRRLGNERTGIVLGAVTVVDEDGRAAREHARAVVQMYFDVVGALDPTVHELPEQITDELLDKFAFAGTPAEVASHVRDVFDAGAKRVEFGAPFGLDPMRGLRLLCEQVTPVFVSRS